MIWVLLAVVFIVFVVLLAAVARAGGYPAAGGCPAGPPPDTKAGGSVARKNPDTAIKWDGPETCYPREMIAECLRLVRGVPGFGPVSAEERAGLASATARLSRKYGVELRAGQLVSMRRMEAGLAARRSGALALRHGEAIAAANAAGEPVLSIAARYRLPPMAVLRQVLIEAGHSPRQIRDAIDDPARLPPKLAAEAPAVFEADLGSRLNADLIRAEAQAYEGAVGAYLRARGIVFETEDDLRKSATGQSPEPDLPLLTPDFLFREPILIDGRRVAWLDAKNYPLYESKLVAASLAKQAAKYTARFGPGAMVFSGGLMCGARVLPKSAGGAQPLLLDGSHIG